MTQQPALALRVASQCVARVDRHTRHGLCCADCLAFELAGFTILPRSPTEVYFDVSTEALETQLYNQIYCCDTTTNPTCAGGCTAGKPFANPATWTDILSREALRVSSLMLALRPEGHMFHQVRFSSCSATLLMASCNADHVCCSLYSSAPCRLQQLGADAVHVTCRTGQLPASSRVHQWQPAEAVDLQGGRRLQHQGLLAAHLHEAGRPARIRKGEPCFYLCSTGASASAKCSLFPADCDVPGTGHA